MSKLVSFFPSIVALLSIISGTECGRTCTHIHPRPDQIIHGATVVHASVNKRSINFKIKINTEQPLRIKLYYDESVYRLDREKFEVINDTILPQAVSYWEQALMVRQTGQVIRLNRKCEGNQVFYRKGEHQPHCKNACEPVTLCGEVPVPETHLDVCRVCNSSGLNCHAVGVPGDGVQGADFIFYISAMETERCHKGLTVAYAAHCQQESELDRPVAGHANLCPESISTQPQELDTLLSTVKHEILHALGFSLSLYAYFRDTGGMPLTPRDDHGRPLLNEHLQARQWSDKVIRNVTRSDWEVTGGVVSRELQMVVTPRVVREVRNHFGCDLLEGAELEDQGEEGTAMTHWEKRAFENEAMTGTHTQNPVYSRVTLALMEDTGWYIANYSLAQPLQWGRGLGCKFAMHSCKEWMGRPDGMPHPFCARVKSEPLQTECAADRRSVALCNLVEYPHELPKQYRNFEYLPAVNDDRITRYGGSVALADYCPYVQEFTWRAHGQVVRGSHCLYEENNPAEDKNFALEKYGPESRCLRHSATAMWEERNCQQRRQWQHWGSGCYKLNCNDGRVVVDVNGHNFPCFEDGQVLQVQLVSETWLHRGALICPPCSEICGDNFCTSYNTSIAHLWKYPKDDLTCGIKNNNPSISSLLLPVSGFIINSIHL